MSLKKPIVLCISDSLGLPRNGVPFDSTWLPSVIDSFDNLHFITRFQRGITTDILIQTKGSEFLELYSPNVIILQLGIVDCAPRLIMPKSFSAYLLKALPSIFHKYYLGYLKLFFSRKKNNVYVSKEKFKSNIKDYLNRCEKIGVQKIIIIGIPIPDDNMKLKNPQIITNANEYNEILASIINQYSFANLIYPLNPYNSDQSIYIDGYHPNKNGNSIVAEMLISELDHDF